MTNQTLKLGPGLRPDGDAIFVMNAGRLRFSKPNKCWVESSEKRVVWGKISRVDAEKRLLANALHDTDNQHFILLSDSFEDPGPHGTGRYLGNMLPEIEKKDWRKGGQWFSMKRHHALLVLADSLYYFKFKNFCKGVYMQTTPLAHVKPNLCH